VDSYQVPNSKHCQKVFKKINQHIGSCIINYQAKKKKIEKHIEEIEPEILPEPGLIFPPGPHPLHDQEEKTNSDQPIKIVLPGWMGNFMP
jgi:hypothetical protein